ncbi:MAG: hypothetical protein Q9183_007863, partial [Haloplaca sp. 2 TL-2023]
ASTMYRTFLHFYAATCYDSIARAMHDLSDTKLATLQKARGHYEATANALPKAKTLASRDSWASAAGSARLDSTETQWFQTPTKTRIARMSQLSQFSQFSPMSPPALTDSHMGSARSSYQALKPSPLRIRIPKPLELNCIAVTPPKLERSENSTSIVSPPSFGLCTPSRHSRQSSTATAWWKSPTASPPQNSHGRYNRLLGDFATMLQGHIASVDHLMSDVQTVQANRHVKRLASFSADKEARSADLRESIVRLRASGWKRTRFRPEKYQDLCEVALAEL